MKFVFSIVQSAEVGVLFLGSLALPQFGSVRNVLFFLSLGSLLDSSITRIFRVDVGDMSEVSAVEMHSARRF